MHIHAYTRTVNKAIYTQYVHTIKMLECITQTTTYCMHKYITYIHTYVQYNATHIDYIHMVAMVTGYMYVCIYIYILYTLMQVLRIYICICAIQHPFQSTYVGTYIHTT